MTDKCSMPDCEQPCGPHMTECFRCAYHLVGIELDNEREHVAKLLQVIKVSRKLLEHYAERLNDWDNGQRVIPATDGEWMERVMENRDRNGVVNDGPAETQGWHDGEPLG
jgi:hypothetical protein